MFLISSQREEKVFTIEYNSVTIFYQKFLKIIKIGVQISLATCHQSQAINTHTHAHKRAQNTKSTPQKLVIDFHLMGSTYYPLRDKEFTKTSLQLLCRSRVVSADVHRHGNPGCAASVVLSSPASASA